MRTDVNFERKKKELCSHNFLEIFYTVFTPRTHKIRREFFSFINIAADYAAPSFGRRGSRLWFYKFMIKRISHCFFAGKNLTIRYESKEQHMASTVKTIYNFTV